MINRGDNIFLSDLAGSWKMTDEEAEKFWKDIRDTWKKSFKK
ncbi:MAG TPA: hypothetical protein VJB66_03780 [Candidatus Nanoarchaeia archaeon]|nr:hypothetical protein [Candidatus Nanoarchaeia archaeon]